MLPFSTFFVYFHLLKEWIETVENWADIIMNLFRHNYIEKNTSNSYDAWTNISINNELRFESV